MAKGKGGKEAAPKQPKKRVSGKKDAAGKASPKKGSATKAEKDARTKQAKSAPKQAAGERVYTSRTRSPEDLFVALTSGYKEMISAEKEIDRRRVKEGAAVIEEVLELAVERFERSVGRWLLPRLVEYLEKDEVLDPKYDVLVHPWDKETLHPVLEHIPNVRRTALFQRHFERCIAEGLELSMYTFEWDHLRMVPDLAPWILQHYHIEHRQKPHAPLEDENWKKLRKKFPSIDAALRAHAGKVGPKPKLSKATRPRVVSGSASRFSFKSTASAYGTEQLDALSKVDRAQFLIAAEAETGKTFKKPSQYAKAMAKELEEDPEMQGVERFEVDGGSEPWVLWHFPATDDGSLFVGDTKKRVPIVLVSGEFLPLDARWSGGKKLAPKVRATLEAECEALSAGFSVRSR
ncbi:MAG: hypothetical protein KC766_00250 [Myxococcales bacterium]|nr:hypothetical protein [Myxococcales bacterium]